MLVSESMCTKSHHRIEWGRSACNCGAVSIDSGGSRGYVSVTLVRPTDGLGKRLGIT